MTPDLLWLTIILSFAIPFYISVKNFTKAYPAEITFDTILSKEYGRQLILGILFLAVSTVLPIVLFLALK